MALVALKRAAEIYGGMRARVRPASMPGEQRTLIPPTFSDVVTALQAEKRCAVNLRQRRRQITGITWDWSIPFVQCDVRKCFFPEQDASSFCEYRVLALAPKSEDTIKLRDWIYLNHPALSSQNSTISEHYFNKTFIKIFDTEEDIERYIESSDYGLLFEKPKIAGAIILNDGYPSYSYSIRANATNFNNPANAVRPAVVTTPPTTKKFDSFAKAPDVTCWPERGYPRLGRYERSCTGQYMYNGVLTLQRLVDDWIIYDSGAEEKGNRVAEAGVSFVPFPNESYTEEGFMTLVARKFEYHYFLSFMFTFTDR